MTYKNENGPQEKKEVFEEPRMVNLEGKEITGEELEDVSGGQAEGSNTCDGGSGDNNTCSSGSGYAVQTA